MSTVETSASRDIDERVMEYAGDLLRDYPHLSQGARQELVGKYQRQLIDQLPSMHALDERIAAAKTAQEARQRDKERAEYAAQEEARAKSEEQLREETWGHFTGTRAAFEASWPLMRDRILAERTAVAVSERQAGFRAQIQGRW